MTAPKRQRARDWRSWWASEPEDVPEHAKTTLEVFCEVGGRPSPEATRGTPRLFVWCEWKGHDPSWCAECLLAEADHLVRSLVLFKYPEHRRLARARKAQRLYSEVFHSQVALTRQVGRANVGLDKANEHLPPSEWA